MSATSFNRMAIAIRRIACVRHTCARHTRVRREYSVAKALRVPTFVSAVALSTLHWNAGAWAQPADWPRSITLSTASPGGPYYAYGQGVAHLLTRALQIETTAQVTQGPAQNIVLMEKKEAMLGFITMGVGLQGWNGSAWAKGTRYRSMRVIFPMFDTAFQFVVPKSIGIKSLAQFAGLRVGVGPRAGTGGTYVPEIFKALGVAAEVRYGAIEAIALQVADGTLDGVATGTGFPIPAFADLHARRPIDFIQPTQEQIAVLRNAMPELTNSLIPAATYQSLTQDYHSIGLYNFAIAHVSLPDDLVYRIVKAVFENHEELVRSYSGAKETAPVHIGQNTLLPIHSGAARYYREVGIDIPPTLVDK